mgnify:CR=1 FL=1
MDSGRELTVGLLAGIRAGALLSPYSAPFGGFHFKKENVYISEIDRFIELLKDYAEARSLDRIEVVTPPDIYNGCLLYTSDAADDLLCVDLGGRRIIKKKKHNKSIYLMPHSHTYTI